MKAKKIISVKNGQVIRIESPKPSAQSRINQLLNALGIDANDYKQSASFRYYNRLANNKHLGIS